MTFNSWAFGRTQALIHRIASREVWPDALDDWVRWAGNGDRTLQDALGRLSTRDQALLHLDYHPMNVLTDGRTITGVLDWSNARCGDPRADVARTYSILMVEPIVPGRQPLVVSLVRRLFTWGWRRGYTAVGDALVSMPWFYAWAGEVMARDLAPRVSDPDSWWEERHLARIRAWGSRWRAQAERATQPRPPRKRMPGA